MEIVRIGLDLAKSVFEVCGVDIRDHVVLRKTLRRDAVAQFFADLPPCLIGMEACSTSHYSAKVLTDLGHQVRLIAPQFVTPYVKSNKNDRNDAEAICEAIIPSGVNADTRWGFPKAEKSESMAAYLGERSDGCSNRITVGF
jgi:transposase